MKKLLSLALLLLPFIMVAQIQTNFNRIQKVQDGIYFMYYDSSSIKHEITKSTIIEFKEKLPETYSQMLIVLCCPSKT